MVLELHENASPTPWLQGAPPDSAALSIERLPGLVYALEQFSLGLANALDPFCRASSGGEVDELRSTNLFQFLSENEGLTVAVLNCAAFDARMLLIFDDRIADTVVTAVFRSGGDGLAPPRSRRSRSAVESALISEFSRYLTQALVKSFEQTGGLALEFEHLETLADVYALGRRDMPAIAAQVTIAAASGSMPLTLLFPQSLLLPIRKSLAYDQGK